MSVWELTEKQKLVGIKKLATVLSTVTSTSVKTERDKKAGHCTLHSHQYSVNTILIYVKTNK